MVRMRMGRWFSMLSRWFIFGLKILVFLIFSLMLCMRICKMYNIFLIVMSFFIMCCLCFMVCRWLLRWWIWVFWWSFRIGWMCWRMRLDRCMSGMSGCWCWERLCIIGCLIWRRCWGVLRWRRRRRWKWKWIYERFFLKREE